MTKVGIGIISIGLFGWTAFATEPEYIQDVPVIEAAFGVSQASRSGQLTDERSGGGFDLSLHLFSPPAEGFGGRSFFDIKFMGQRFNADTTDFPFVTGNDIAMTVFGFVSNLSVWHDDRSIVFVGVGPGIATLSQRDPKRSDQGYGAFLWQAGHRRDLAPRWSLGVKGEWFSIDQTVLERETFFGSFTTSVQVGYVLR